MALASCAVALVAGMAAAAGAESDRGRLVGGGSGEHLYWVAPGRASGEELRLVHGVVTADGFEYRIAGTYDEHPEALAVRGARVWVVFPSTLRAARRDVITFESRRNPATGLLFTLPTSGAELVASLPREGHVAGFVADERDLWALMLPGGAERFGVRREGRPVDRTASGPTLLRLAGTEWEAVALPDAAMTPAAVARGPRLGVLDGRAALLLAEGERLDVVVRDETSPSGWAPPISLDDVRSDPALLEVAGRPALVDGQGDELRFRYLRGAGAERTLLGWARVPRPRDPFAIAGTARGAILVEQGRELRKADDPASAAEVFRAVRIDPLSGRADPPLRFAPPIATTSRWMHVPLVAMFALAALLGFLFIRELHASRAASGAAEGGGEGDGPESEPPAPPPMPMPRRIAALAIDLLPGAVVALLLLDARPTDLLRLPSLVLDRSAADPSIVMILIACAHGWIGEAFVGRSLGKWACGGIVLAPDGSPLGIGRVTLRALLKLLVLAAPVLGVVSLLAADGRGVPDVIARAIVADARSPRSAG